jgi:hypothetical protein
LVSGAVGIDQVEAIDDEVADADFDRVADLANLLNGFVGRIGDLPVLDH